MGIEDFRDLLKDTDAAFNQSDIKEYAQQNNFSWAYSVSATKIVPNNILILGFNWGAEHGYEYSPQRELPKCSFMELKQEDFGSLKRILPYLRKYIPEDKVINIGQSNYCFFRSRKESQISGNDLGLSKPLFMKFVSLAQPSTLIILSGSLREYLLNHYPCSDLSTSSPYCFSRGGWEYQYQTLKGRVMIGTNDVPFYSLPHPNYPIPSRMRDASWQFCFKRNV